MDEPQKEPNQCQEGQPRKVRFKISSSYSGRVLKQVFEDGQELELPTEEHSRRFPRNSFEPEDNYCGLEEEPDNRFYWPTALTARRISILREDQTHSLSGISSLLSDCLPGTSHCGSAPVIDFGKIIIYTNNLKIVRAPMDQKELMRRIIQTDGVNDWTFMYQERKERLEGGPTDVGKKIICNQYMQDSDAYGCLQCKGSGSAPCSLCHGSKFSMLANRFKESYRALRCPACDESGLQPCQ
ncbi:PREDICTED: glutaredoxin domain-containing cysteine-rich protein 2, partial [Acanthisitta chloris]